MYKRQVRTYRLYWWCVSFVWFSISPRRTQRDKEIIWKVIHYTKGYAITKLTACVDNAWIVKWFIISPKIMQNEKWSNSLLIDLKCTLNNLPPVLMMYVLWVIHNFSKENAAWQVKQRLTNCEFYKRHTTTYRLYWRYVNFWVIRNFSKENVVWQMIEVLYRHCSLRERTKTKLTDFGW